MLQHLGTRAFALAGREALRPEPAPQLLDEPFAEGLRRLSPTPGARSGDQPTISKAHSGRQRKRQLGANDPGSGGKVLPARNAGSADCGV